MNRPPTRSTSDLTPPGEIKSWSPQRIFIAYLIMFALACGSIVLIDHYAMVTQTDGPRVRR